MTEEVITLPQACERFSTQLPALCAMLRGVEEREPNAHGLLVERGGRAMRIVTLAKPGEAESQYVRRLTNKERML